MNKLKTIDQYVQFSKADGALRKKDLKVKEAAFAALEELATLLDSKRPLPQLSHRSIVNLSKSLVKTTEKLRQDADPTTPDALAVTLDQREDFMGEHNYMADYASNVHQVVQEKLTLFNETRQVYINKLIEKNVDLFQENEGLSLRKELKNCESVKYSV